MKAWVAFVALVMPVMIHAHAPADGYEDIVVEGLKDPYRISPKQLREAVSAYSKRQAELAPSAPLRFAIFRYRFDPALQEVRFRLLADNGDTIPITLDSNGQFVLPPLDYSQKLYALQANRKSGSVRVRPLIMSPDSSDDNRRMGDLRLECAVNWAMLRDNFSVFVRGIAGAAGGPCTSSTFSVFRNTERALASGSITDGKLSKPLQIAKDGSAYRMPGYIKSFGNDTRVRFTYR
jgi:hypothetical protein